MAEPIDLRSLVRPWVKGEKISENGIYSGVSMDAYHGDLCIGPSVSRSQIWTADEKSPKHAFKDWYGNPNRKPPGVEAEHFALGRAIHHLASGEANFAKFFAVRPQVFDSWRTGDAKKWRGEQIALGMGVLTPDDVDQIRGVADSMNEHPTIQAGIMQGLVEHTLAWKDERTGLWFKSRIDVIAVDSRMLADLKTTTDARRHKVQKANSDFGYHVQMAMADEGLKVITGSPKDRPWASEHVDIFVEKKDPWCINIKPFEAFEIDYARRILARGAEKIARSISDNLWQGYDDDLVPGGLPKWYLDKLKWESENGLLPKLDGPTSKSDFKLPDREGPPVDDADDEEDDEEAVG